MSENYPNSIRANLAESYVRLGERMQTENLESIACRAPIVRCDDVVVPIIGANPRKFSMGQFNIAVGFSSEGSETSVGMSLVGNDDLRIGMPFRDPEAMTPPREIMRQIRGSIGYTALRGAIESPVGSSAGFALYGVRSDSEVKIVENHIGETYNDEEAWEFMQIICTVLTSKLKA